MRMKNTGIYPLAFLFAGGLLIDLWICFEMSKYLTRDLAYTALKSIYDSGIRRRPNVH
jgi:hypothetical protein